MVFGQPRQDDLMTFLLERCSPKFLEEIEPLLRIDLSPKPTVRLPGSESSLNWKDQL